MKIQKGAQGNNSTSWNPTVVSNDTDYFASNLEFVTQVSRIKFNQCISFTCHTVIIRFQETEQPDECIDIFDMDNEVPIDEQQVNLVIDENRNAFANATIGCTILDHTLQDKGELRNSGSTNHDEVFRRKVHHDWLICSLFTLTTTYIQFFLLHLRIISISVII